jgi:hypothetical protein
MWYREPPPFSAFDEEIEEYLLIERERDFLLALVLYGEDAEKGGEEKGDREKGS